MTTLLLVVLTVAIGQVPSPGEPQSQPIAIINATIHIGDGKVIQEGTITFDGGKITGIGTGDAVGTTGHLIINGEGKQVYPGFILPNTTLGLNEIASVRATVDEEEQGNINPNIRSAISYNTDSEIIPTYRFNGILLAQSTPQGGLIPGKSSIVQLDAWNWEDALVREDDALHLSWPRRFRRQFDFDTYTVKQVENKSYAEEIRVITELFKDAAAYQSIDHPEIINLKLAALEGLFTGDMSLYFHSEDPKSMIEGISYLEELGVKKITCITGSGALMIADFLSEKDIPVIVANLHVLPEHPDNPVLQPYEVPGRLVKAGVKVGLGYEAGMNANSRNLPFLAGTAAGHGLDKEVALQLITKNNAEILGIEDMYGTLEAGKSATLFVSEGDALDMRGNVLLHAFIDGREIILPAMQQRLYQKYYEKYASQAEQLKNPEVKSDDDE